jgi:hypothetical protein
MLLITRRDAPQMLKSIETALDHVPSAVTLSIDLDDALAITPRWNDRFYSAFSEAISYSVAIICLISGKVLGAQTLVTATEI